MKLTLPSQYDFLPRFFGLAVANILSSLMEPLAGAISAGFLGHLSEIRHLTGTALAGTLFGLIYFGMYFLRQSTTGVTAQAVGRGDRSEELLVALRNGCIALGIGVILLLLQYPLQHVWFALVSGAPEVKAAGMDYFSARIWGAPAVLLNFVVMGWLFGKEQSGRVQGVTIRSKDCHPLKYSGSHLDGVQKPCRGTTCRAPTCTSLKRELL